MSGSRSIFAINKKDPSIQTQIDVGSGVDVGTFRSSGSYCVLAVQHGRELRVYEDSPDAQFQLVRIHHIRPNISCQTTVEMYRNWVCVNQGEEFYILDVRNGREIVSQKLNWGKAYLQVSSQALLVSQKYHDTFWGDQRKLSLYDFSGRASQAPSDSSWCDIV